MRHGGDRLIKKCDYLHKTIKNSWHRSQQSNKAEATAHPSQNSCSFSVDFTMSRKMSPWEGYLCYLAAWLNLRHLSLGTICLWTLGERIWSGPSLPFLLDLKTIQNSPLFHSFSVQSPAQKFYIARFCCLHCLKFPPTQSGLVVLRLS